MNTYKKYCPNVFVALCEEKHQKGDVIELTTKYGKEHECDVHNLLGYSGTKEEPKFLYSITRTDGFNAQERAKNKVEKLQGYAVNAEKRSNAAYEASHEGKDFLSLGEPIKIGHHSERRHRALIARNWARMDKSVAESEKAKDYIARCDYWEAKTKEINLSMPESINFFEFKLLQAEKNQKFLKDNPDKRPHSYSLTYASKLVKDTIKNLEIAVKLWGTAEEIRQLMIEKEEAAEKKATKKKGVKELIKKYGGFFFFGSDLEAFKKKYQNIKDAGHIEEGEKVKLLKDGFHLPAKNVDAFLKESK